MEPKFIFFLSFFSCSLCAVQGARHGRAESTHGNTQKIVQREHESFNRSLRDQTTLCTFSSQELTETVELISTSVLEGVCNPSEMEARFRALETLITTQLSEIKESLTVLEERMVDQYEESAKCVEAASGSSASRLTTKSGASVSSSVSASAGNSTTNNRRTPLESVSAPITLDRGSGAEIRGRPESNQQTTTSGGQSNPVVTPGPSEQSGPGVSPQRVGYGTSLDDRDRIYDQQFYASEADVFSYTEAGGGRAEEISKYNMTVHTEDGRRVFSYYWVITDMTYKLKHWNLRANARSNKFYVHPSGYRLYMKITPRFDQDSTYLNVGLTKGEYDDIIHWPFNHPMRLYILAHGKGPNSSYDLKSRMWNPWELCSGSNWKKPTSSNGGDNTVCLGLGFPHNVIEQPLYLWNDCLTVKLNVYVD